MNIAVYCGSGKGNRDSYYEGAKKLGESIANHGHTLVFGGSDSGLMGAVSNGVLGNGGKVIGVVPDVPLIKERTHKRLTECIYTDTIAQRRTKMIELADAFIALPGGVGTFDEITEVLSLQSLKIVDCPIVFVNIEGYYDPMKAVIDGIVKNGFGVEKYFERVLFADDAEEIMRFVEG